MTTVTCPSCGATVATITWIETRGEDPDVEPWITGRTVTLEPGYVNVGRLHPSGAAWYRRDARNPERPSQKVRPPSVVTCRCRGEVTIDAMKDGKNRVLAAPSRSTPTDAEVDEAGDQWIHADD